MQEDVEIRVLYSKRARAADTKLEYETWRGFAEDYNIMIIRLVVKSIHEVTNEPYTIMMIETLKWALLIMVKAFEWLFFSAIHLYI